MFSHEIEFSCHFLLKASINNSARERTVGALAHKDSGIRFDLKSLKMSLKRPVLLEFLEAWEQIFSEFEKPFGYNSNRIKVNGTAKQLRRKLNEKNFSPNTKKKHN